MGKSTTNVAAESHVGFVDVCTVKDEETFLDFIAKQVISMRKEHGFPVKFMLMNSFSTSDDTLNFLKSKYPDLAAEEGLEMLQNKVPKLDAETLEVSARNHECVFFGQRRIMLSSLFH